jgi:acyl carrier protein
VLRGIGEAHWPRIDQAVIEVDREAHLHPIVSLLQEHDFQVLVEQDPLLERTELRYVYAARRGSGRLLTAGAGSSVPLPTFTESFLTPEDLRAHLRGWLPDAMQPAAWVFLEALPLTANGKLDRARLPQPEVAGSSYLAPRGELQRAIAGIWSEILGISRVGARDNFFDLGGHSLLLARVHARLREVLKAEISIVELFRFPTVASLATHLAGNGVRLDVAKAHRQRGARRRDAARTRVARSRATTSGADA